MRRKKSNRQRKNVFIFLLIIGLTIGGYRAYDIYKMVFTQNTKCPEGSCIIYIPTGAVFKQVMDTLTQNNILIDSSSFVWVAHKKKYDNWVKPGRYSIKNSMNNNQLVNMLRSGNQEPVKVLFNNIRFKEELAATISKQIEADSASIANLMNDNDFLDALSFNKQSVPAMFIPNTYEFFWNTSARQFMNRMEKEYNRFWTGERTKKKDDLNLSKIEVSTLASIVDEETFRDDEMPKIAGVYLNRLEKNIRLQADPTIKFAISDFEVRRILKKHLKIESPYNTYLNAGLPPGPIAIPSIEAIDAVLNYDKHEYLYFCAKDDFSGYHAFAKTHAQHIVNARKYRRALNRRRIYR
jgi:UPF0755 protein